MIRLSYRDIDKEYNLSPEQSGIKQILLDQYLNMSTVNDAYSRFISSTSYEIENAISEYIADKINSSPAKAKLNSVDAEWAKLTPEQQKGPEGDRLSELGGQLEDEIALADKEIKESMGPMYDAIFAQLISWKVD